MSPKPGRYCQNGTRKDRPRCVFGCWGRGAGVGAGASARGREGGQGRRGEGSRCPGLVFNAQRLVAVGGAMGGGDAAEPARGCDP